jgi:hypothetical protein
LASDFSQVNSVKLYRAWMKVRPSVEHPLFFDVQFGILTLWLFASDSNSAANRAVQFADLLPFELVTLKEQGSFSSEADEQCQVLTNCDGDNPPADLRQQHAEALKVGFAIHFAAWTVGSDESPFLDG